MEKHTIQESLDETECSGCQFPTSSEIAQFERAIRAIVGKWKIEILFALMYGPLRFGELRRCLPGVTQHMLTTQLRELESNGLVLRTAYAEVPPRVSYELTEAANALKPAFESLLEWSRIYKTDARATGRIN